MVVHYQGESSQSKQMPGGGPQGTLLGLLLFLVLINLCCQFDRNLSIGTSITNPPRKFAPSTFCAKFMDDMSIAEAINLNETLIVDHQMEQPVPYHSRFHVKLPPQSSKVYSELKSIKSFSESNHMKLNLDKTKFIVFNPTKKFDFHPECKLDETEIEAVEELKILGTIIRSDLSWKSNTKMLVDKAYKKLWIIKRLKKNGASHEDLLDIYIKKVRSIIEFGLSVWNAGLTEAEVHDIERVQKSFLHILLGNKYIDYKSALLFCGMESLSDRRTNLCKKFAQKTYNNSKHTHWFTMNQNTTVTRRKGPKFILPKFKHDRYRKSPLYYLTTLLNSD